MNSDVCPVPSAETQTGSCGYNGVLLPTPAELPPQADYFGCGWSSMSFNLFSFPRFPVNVASL